MNRKIQVRFLEGKGGVIRPTYSILIATKDRGIILIKTDDLKEFALL